MDLTGILQKIAIPRPNHSESVKQTAEYIKELLSSWNVPFVVQDFILRPHMQLLVGLTALIIAVLFFIFVIRKKPLFALIMALAIPALLIIEFEAFIPVVSSLIQTAGENIIVSFTAPNAVQEIIFCAHYDSKTDFFDHIERAKIYKWIPQFIVLGLLLPIWLFRGKKFKFFSNRFSKTLTGILSTFVVIFWLLVFLGFGGYIFIDKKDQSFGAIDNGGSVVTLLALAKDINEGRVKTGKTNITILLTQGEEVTLQGADSYIKKRFLKTPVEPKLPTKLVNLELVGQNGNMIYWKKVGVFLKFYTSDEKLAEQLNKAWIKISGNSMDMEKKITDDSQRFCAADIPSITVGHSGIPGKGMGGFHSTDDSMDRFNLKNLKLMIAALGTFIEAYDN
ncbi:MAG: M28 family peptidase [Deltaproteobacteria bacterium]|nr:M28 family peptidase [Deltaproteobacteria bacterium]